MARRSAWQHFIGRARRSANLKWLEDGVVAVIVAALGYAVLDRDAAWENAVLALGLGLGAGLLWQVVRFAYRFVWAVPREIENERDDKQDELERMRATARITSEQWRAMAERFAGFTHNVVWYEIGGMGKDDQGHLLDRWHIRGGLSRDAEEVCALAGAMLLQCPKLAEMLPYQANRTDDLAWKWLYFVGHVRKELKYEEAVPSAIAELKSLGASSRRACTFCESALLGD